MNDPNSAPLRARLGPVYFLAVAAALIPLVFSIYGLLRPEPVLWLYAPLTALSGWLLLTLATLRLELHPEYLLRKSLWATRQNHWKDMAVIRPALGPLTALLTLRGFRSRRHSLLLLPFDNREELLKALIDQSWRANPNVRLSPVLTSRYGFPPYSRRRKAERETTDR